MYSDTAIRFARADRSQLTRTSRQTPDRLLHFLGGGKVASVGLGQALLDFGDLPFVYRDILLDCLGGDEGTAAAHGFRQTVELFLKLGVEAKGKNGGFWHDVYIVHHS